MFFALIKTLSNYLPLASVTYCNELWQYYQFELKITKPRRTRLGDFRVLGHNQTQITVNANLNPYAFLITYVHEVAHAAVYHQHKSLRRNRIKPHGKAWQTAFQQLMKPLLNDYVFPVYILQPLQQYLIKPAATTSANPALITALRQADPRQLEPLNYLGVLLRDVAEGQLFRFAKKTYVRGTLRRTRVVCKEISSGKSYAILAHILVEVDPE